MCPKETNLIDSEEHSKHLFSFFPAQKAFNKNIMTKKMKKRFMNSKEFPEKKMNTLEMEEKTEEKGKCIQQHAFSFIAKRGKLLALMLIYTQFIPQVDSLLLGRDDADERK